jgi:hypothetical protein
MCTWKYNGHHLSAFWNLRCTSVAAALVSSHPRNVALLPRSAASTPRQCRITSPHCRVNSPQCRGNSPQCLVSSPQRRVSSPHCCLALHCTATGFLTGYLSLTRDFKWRLDSLLHLRVPVCTSQNTSSFSEST